MYDQRPVTEHISMQVASRVTTLTSTAPDRHTHKPGPCGLLKRSRLGGGEWAKLSPVLEAFVAFAGSVRGVRASHVLVRWSLDNAKNFMRYFCEVADRTRGTGGKGKFLLTWGSFRSAYIVVESAPIAHFHYPISGTGQAAPFRRFLRE